MDLPASQDNEYLANDVVREGLNYLEKAMRSFNLDIVNQRPYEFQDGELLEHEHGQELTAYQKIPTITIDLVDLEDSEDSEDVENLEN